jgi:hypothetical protein
LKRKARKLKNEINDAAVFLERGMALESEGALRRI